MLSQYGHLVRFRQTAAGLQCTLVETRRIDGAVRYEQVARRLGSRIALGFRPHRLLAARL